MGLVYPGVHPGGNSDPGLSCKDRFIPGMNITNILALYELSAPHLVCFQTLFIIFSSLNFVYFAQGYSFEFIQSYLKEDLLLPGQGRGL